MGRAPAACSPAVLVLINDYRLTHLNIEAHLAQARSLFSSYSYAVAIFGAAVGTNLWCSPHHNRSVRLSLSDFVNLSPSVKFVGGYIYITNKKGLHF